LSAVPHCTFLRIHRRIPTSSSQSFAIHFFLNWKSSTDSEGTHAMQRHNIESFTAMTYNLIPSHSLNYPFIPYIHTTSSNLLLFPSSQKLKAPLSFQNYILPTTLVYTSTITYSPDKVCTHLKMLSIKSFAFLPAAVYVFAGEMVRTKATSAIAPIADTPAPTLDIRPRNLNLLPEDPTYLWMT
jgi:hypothetical protein